MEKNLEPIAAEEPKKTSFLNPKVFLIGLPVFIIQLVIVYFVTANILLSKIEGSKDVKPNKDAKQEQSAEAKKDSIAKRVELGKYIYNIDDIICNVAETNGRLLLVSIGFDLGSQEQLELVKSKQILVQDITISVLSAKNIAQLSNVAYRDTIKTEISKNVLAAVPKTNINDIYFYKYIIQ